MASYNILVANSTKATNNISFTIPANTGKSYKVKVEAPAGSYGTWYYNSLSTSKTYTININVVYLSKIRITVSESNDTNAEVKIYTPLTGQSTKTEQIVDPNYTNLQNYKTIALAVPSLLTAVAAQLNLKKTKTAIETFSYTLTFSAIGLAAFNLIFNVAASVPPVAEVTTSTNITSSTIYVTSTLKHDDGTTETTTNQKSIPGF